MKVQLCVRVSLSAAGEVTSRDASSAGARIASAVKSHTQMCTSHSHGTTGMLVSAVRLKKTIGRAHQSSGPYIASVNEAMSDSTAERVFVQSQSYVLWTLVPLSYVGNIKV